MAKNIGSVLSLLLVILFSAPFSSALAQTRNECPRSAALETIKQAAIEDGALIEPVHLKGGLIIMVAAKTEQGIGALQRAAANYEKVRASFLSAKQKRPCDPVWDAVTKHTLDETIERTSRGFVVAYSSSSPKIVEYLHRSGCCDYCVCPAGTVTSCASCCK